MELLAISPEADYADEANVIVRLFEAGLSRYHLRKPAWSAASLAALLGEVDPACYSKIVLHQHYELVREFGLGGYHFKDLPDVSARRDAVIAADTGARRTLSRSLHRIENLDMDAKNWDYVFLSPVFSSISKQGHAPAWSEGELQAALGSAGNVRALGGVCSANVGRCEELGFDGVVLHGTLWPTVDPIEAFKEIQKKRV